MCTATWRFSPDGDGWALDLGFNRDERRSRPRARPPRVVRSADGLPFIAPMDPVGGGSWLALNAAGLCLGLLNHYEPEGRPPTGVATISRGQLVWRLAALPDAEGVRAGLRRILEGERPQPFDLLLAKAGKFRQVLRLRWDGEALREEDLSEGPPLISSSAHDPRNVVAGRLAQHTAISGGGPLDAAARLAFHRSHRPKRGARSVCMHRPDARTVSYSQLRVATGELSFRYAAGAPCRARLGPPLCLERQA